jgi:homoserine O-acetyltransferase
MEWQFSEDTVPSTFVTDAQVRSLLGKPPVTGGWRDGDPVGDRRFLDIGALDLEAGGHLGAVRIAYETWGELSPIDPPTTAAQRSMPSRSLNAT